MFKHNFDLGAFNFYSDNGDGTAMFYTVEIIGEDINPIRIEERLILYKWNSMRKKNGG